MNIDERMDEITQQVAALMSEHDKLKADKAKSDILRLLSESKDHLTIRFSIAGRLFSAFGSVRVLEDNEINIIPMSIWEVPS